VLHLVVVNKKRKKKNINNDLANLPSHDKCFVGLYKVKRIISSNAIELELTKSIRIHPVINVSRVWLYKPQIEGQKKIPPKPVIIEGEEEFEVEKILNKRTVRGKEKFLVQ